MRVSRSALAVVAVVLLAAWGPAAADAHEAPPRASGLTVNTSAISAVQQAQLLAPNGNPNDQFGTAVAVSGDTAVVGSYKWPSEGMSGEACVYTRSGDSWTWQANLMATPEASYESFGYSVAVSGDTAVVGAIDEDVGSTIDQGVVYVFARTGSTWSRQATLTASAGVEGMNFGWSVAIEGDRLVVGAPGHGAYVFTRSGSNWSETGHLTLADASGWLGASVALSGDTVVVGAFHRDVAGGSADQGEAYVFVESGGLWSQQSTLTAPDGLGGDSFGYSVAVSGDTALVGAYQHDHGGATNRGAAYVFERSGATWTPQAEFAGADSAAYDGFGRSVAIVADTALVGAPWHLGGGVSATANGAGYVFTRSGSSWSQDVHMTGESPGDHLGHAVGLSDGVGVLGAPDDDVGSPSANISQGSAYVFALGHPPVAVDDAWTVNENTTLVVPAPGALANDTDVDSDPLSLTDVSAVSAGTLEVAASGAATYTPPADFHGEVTFTYRADDGIEYSNLATVRITVVPVPTTTSFTVTSASKTLAKYGDAYTFAGTLVAGGAPLSGRRVILQSATSATGAFTDTSMMATTTASGGFSVRMVPRDLTYYRVCFAGEAGEYAASTSVSRYGKPRHYAGTPKAPSAMSRTRYYSVYGYLRPRHTVGAKPVVIKCYKKNSSGVYKYHHHVHAKVSDYSTCSKYRASVRLPHKGTWRLSAYAATDSIHAFDYSGYDYVTVK